MASSTAGPSRPLPRTISGTAPGQLDATQIGRLLRLPGSTLSFASFNPLTASADRDIPDVRKLSLNDDLYRPRRVVIETTPSGMSFWRFVPNARKQAGVTDEGSWPRVVDICGEFINCSQDQWDIYKLDPEYECFVPLPPYISVITHSERKVKPTSRPISSHPDPLASWSTPTTRTKRRPSTPTSERETTPTPSAKKMRPDFTTTDEDGFEDTEDEAEMMVDDNKPRSSVQTERVKRSRADMEEKRRLRREKIAQADIIKRQKKWVEENMDILPESAPSTPKNNRRPNPMVPPSTGKRKDVIDSDVEAMPENCPSQSHKRTRTLSPTSVKRDMADRRAEREKKRKYERDRVLHGRKEDLKRAFMDYILADLPENGSSAPDRREDGDFARDGEDDEEKARMAAIAESRRKLAELEADRPLWEQAARERQRREEALAEAERKERLARQGAQAMAKQPAEAKQRAAKQSEDHARIRAEATALEQSRRRHEEREARLRVERARWSYGLWTTNRALERYLSLSDTFDKTKFSQDEPILFELVPWPVLHSPATLTVEAVDWGGVESFFKAARNLMRVPEFKIFVQKSHRRFHPDRWSSRGLLITVADESERGYLEVALNTVAQAITPLWAELREK